MIHMKINNKIAKVQCSISGNLFLLGVPFAFFIKGNPDRPVCPQTAYEKGYIIDDDTFAELSRIVYEHLSRKMKSDGFINNVIQIIVNSASKEQYGTK